MIYIQYKYAIQLAIIVSSPFVRERREHNEISKKMDSGADFLKNQQGTKKGRYKILPWFPPGLKRPLF